MKSNLVKRILVAAIAIPAILLITWLGGYFFLAFAAIIVFIAQWEFYAICRTNDIDIHVTTGLLGGLIILISFYYVQDQGYIGIIAAVFLVVLLGELKLFDPNNGVSRIAFTMFGILYCAFYSATPFCLENCR